MGSNSHAPAVRGDRRFLDARPGLTNRVRENFTHGSVGGVGREPGPYPAANAGGARQLPMRTRGAACIAQFCR